MFGSSKNKQIITVWRAFFKPDKMSGHALKILKEKEKELRESSPTKLLMGWKQKRWTTSAVFLSELKEKKSEGGRRVR